MTPAARLAYALRLQLARSEVPEVSRASGSSPRASGPSSPEPAVVAPLAAAGSHVNAA